MNAEVDDAAAASEDRIAKPRLVWPVGVVEDEVDRVHGRDRGDPLAQRPGRSGVAVGEIDSEQAIGAPRGAKDALGLGRSASQRLLAEDGEARLERGDGLVCVQRARGGDDDPVEGGLQQTVEAACEDDIGDVLGGRQQALRCRICEHGDLGHAAVGNRAHPVPADPARAEKAQPRPGRCTDRAHGDDRPSASATAEAVTAVPAP
jgi:hypothetical protein